MPTSQKLAKFYFIIVKGLPRYGPLQCWSCHEPSLGGGLTQIERLVLGMVSPGLLTLPHHCLAAVLMLPFILFPSRLTLQHITL